MDGVVPIKSPFWKTTKAEVVRSLDDLMDVARYDSAEHFQQILVETARKNPEEMQFYLDTIVMRIELIKEIISDATKEDIQLNDN